MNFICWLLDHKWTKRGVVKRADDPKPQRFYTRCERCKASPYDDTPLAQWLANTRIVPRVKAFAKRARLWIKSRRCWTPGHDWSPVSCYCQRCGMSGVEDAERGEWMLPTWKKLWRGWLHDRFHVVKPYLQEQAIYAVEALGQRFGVEKSTLYINEQRYMTRYIAYFGPLCLRLHKFYRGDDDSAPHTHPWAFVTFPFSTYRERRFQEGVELPGEHLVKAWRFHYRPATHEHIVTSRMRKQYTADYTRHYVDWVPDNRPFWTFVMTGPRSNDWGFYPKPGKFVYWRDYKPGKRTGVKPT